MKVIKILLAVLGVFIALCVVVWVAAGLIIPAEGSCTNEIEINAPADKVWQVVTDKSKYTTWQPNLSRVEVIDDKNWVEYPKDSPEPLRFTVGMDARPERMVFEYKMGDSFDGNWYGYATPTATGTKLETVDVYVTRGWVTKILIYLFFDYDKFAKDWNGRLKAQVEKGNQ